MQKSRQGFKTTVLSLCLSLGLTQAIWPFSTLAKETDSVSSNGILSSSAPIGTVVSSGTMTINGRPVVGTQSVWNGELLEAPNDATAVVKLASLGELNLNHNTKVRLAATGRTLVAAVYEGTAEIAVAPNATGYLEAAGEAWIVEGDTSLKLVVNSGMPTLHTLRGTVHHLGSWSLNLPSFNSAAVSNTNAIRENAEVEAQAAERAALMRSIKMVTNHTDSASGVRLVANVGAAQLAMLGMIESDGVLKLNGRATRRQELLWDGEIIQAAADAEARAALANFGSVRLAAGTRAQLATAAVAGSDRRVLTANLFNGEFTVRLDANAAAYVETCGKAFSAEPGAHFRLSEQQGNVTLEIKAGKVREIANLMTELTADLLNDEPGKPRSEGTFSVRPADKAGYLRHLKPQEKQDLRFLVTDGTGKAVAGVSVFFSLAESNSFTVGTLGAGEHVGRTYEARTDEQGIAVVPFTAGRFKGSASIMAVVGGASGGNSNTVVVGDDDGFWKKRNAWPVFATLGGAVAAGVVVGLTREEKLPILGRGNTQIVP